MDMRHFINLIEARRNPDVNQKISATDAIKKYKNRDDIFITFVDKLAGGTKIGINPQSTYGTPLGIYAYPIDYVIQYGIQDMPFAGERAFLWIFQASGSNIIISDQYSEDQLKKDMKKVSDFLHRNVDSIGGFSVEDYADGANINTPSGKLWNVTREAANKIAWQKQYERNTKTFGQFEAANTIWWNTIFRKVLGYGAFVDKLGQGIIHSNEPTQAVFFSKEAVKPIELIRNIHPSRFPPSKTDIYAKSLKTIQRDIKNKSISKEEFAQYVKYVHGERARGILLTIAPLIPKEYKREIADNFFELTRTHSIEFRKMLFASISDVITYDDLIDFLMKNPNFYVYMLDSSFDFMRIYKGILAKTISEHGIKSNEFMDRVKNILSTNILKDADKDKLLQHIFELITDARVRKELDNWLNFWDDHSWYVDKAAERSKTFGIAEARRNPAQNPKIFAYDALKKYAGQTDVYVSFTDDVGIASHKSSDKKFKYLDINDVSSNAKGAKLGINPTSYHDTPVGIYGYPIDHVLEQNLRMEYGNGRPYIWVFRYKNPNKILNIQEYTRGDLEKDFQKLVKLYPERLDGVELPPNNRIQGYYIWNITRKLSVGELAVLPKNSVWTNIFLKLGYEGVVDNTGTIHRNEPKQGVFFGKNTIDTLELIRNISQSDNIDTSELIRNFHQK